MIKNKNFVKCKFDKYKPKFNWFVPFIDVGHAWSGLKAVQASIVIIELSGQKWELLQRLSETLWDRKHADSLHREQQQTDS